MRNVARVFAIIGTSLWGLFSSLLIITTIATYVNIPRIIASLYALYCLGVNISCICAIEGHSKTTMVVCAILNTIAMPMCSIFMFCSRDKRYL